MYGVIDIGSNTIRLSVYKLGPDSKLNNRFNKKVSAGLAGYIDEQGKLSEQGITAIISALSEFKGIIESVDMKQLFVFATASLRNVINTEEVVKIAHQETGFDIEILSGEEEAFCSFIGAGIDTKLVNGILADIGGGSTELVFYKNREIYTTVSFPAGSLNMYYKHVSKIFPTKDEMAKIEKNMVRYLARMDMSEFENLQLCGVGGSIRGIFKLSGVLSEASKPKSMTGKDLKKLIKDYEKNTKEITAKIVQVSPDRSHTILPGMSILNAIVKYFNSNSIIVSKYGVREGYLLSKIK